MTASNPKYESEGNDRPMLLKAVELIIAKPETIKKQAKGLLKKYRSRYKEDRSDDDIREMAAKKIIQNYSYAAAFSGGATSLSGVVPGLGTVLTSFGGAAADVALCMKFQVEMTMALASIYDHDIEVEEEKLLCFIIAGLGAINQAAKEGTKELSTKAFTRLVQKHLTGSVLATTKAIFSKLGITFTRKSLVKSIPFGAGVVIGFSANKGITWYIGEKAHDFFRTN